MCSMATHNGFEDGINNISATTKIGTNLKRSHWPFIPWSNMHIFLFAYLGIKTLKIKGNHKNINKRISSPYYHCCMFLSSVIQLDKSIHLVILYE